MVAGCIWLSPLTFQASFTGLGLQRWYNDVARVGGTRNLWLAFAFMGSSVGSSPLSVGSIRAGVTRGVGDRRVVYGDAADNIPALFGKAGGNVFLLLLLISVAADSDDAHSRAGRIGDDDCLALMINT